jgi:hypothetical protein
MRIAATWIVVALLCSQAAAAPTFLDRPIWTGALPLAQKQMLTLARRLMESPRMPRFRGDADYTTWLNKAYAPLARRSQQDRLELDKLAAGLAGGDDRAFAAVLSAHVLDALYRRDRAVDDANPAAEMMASAGIGNTAYAERAAQVADVSERCMELTKNASAPLAAWSEHCATLASRYSSLVDDLCNGEAAQTRSS